jgi:hypothetical protein
MLKPLAVLGGFDDRAVNTLHVNPRAFTCKLFRVSSLGMNTHVVAYKRYLVCVLLKHQGSKRCSNTFSADCLHSFGVSK